MRWRGVGGLAFGFGVALAIAYAVSAVQGLGRVESQQGERVELRSTQALDLPPARQVVAGGAAGRERFYIATGNSVAIHDPLSGTTTTVDLQAPVRVIAASVDGNVYAADEARTIHVLVGDRVVRVFRVAQVPASMAALSDGTLVVRGQRDSNLAHVLKASGRSVRSIGKTKGLSPNADQNAFLNSGLIVAAPNDDLYFVNNTNPEPFVVRMNAQGEVLSEFVLEGEAIAIQAKAQRQHLARNPDATAGLLTVQGVAVDPKSGSLWVTVGGSTQTPLLYEYDETGRKQRESHLTVDGQPVPVAHGIAFNTSHVAVLYWGRVFVAHRDDLIKEGLAGQLWWIVDALETPANAQSSCPAEQPWGECGATCPQYGASSVQLDCKGQLESFHNAQFNRVVGSQCTNSSSGCYAQVSLCDLNTYATTHHSTENPVPCPSPCSAGGCPPGYTKDCVGDQQPDPEQCNCCVNYSPILVDTSGRGGMRFSDAAGGVPFAINELGLVLQVAWPLDPRDDAFLFLDRNGNGLVDDGSELFGNTTPLEAGGYGEHGYAALAELDENGDAWVDSADSGFHRLRLWHDLDRDGVSKPSELVHLLSDGILRLSTRARPSPRVDRHGNRYAFRAAVVALTGPVRRHSYDVFLVAACMPSDW